MKLVLLTLIRGVLCMKITINDNLISQIQIDEIIEMLFKYKEEELQIVAHKSTVNSSTYSVSVILLIRTSSLLI